MYSQVVSYQVDDSATVRFEIEPTDGFIPASSGHASGQVHDAVAPCVEAARAVFDALKEIGEEVELTFGIKVVSGTDWVIAKSPSEANFAIRLKSSSKDSSYNSH